MIQSNTLKGQSIGKQETLELQDDREIEVSKQNKGVELDNRSNDSDSEEEVIPYGRPELQDFDPKLLSPPKYTKIKDTIRKRVKAGLTNIIIFIWDLLFLITSVVLLVVYYKDCTKCEQPIWSWLLVNACASFVCCCTVLFVKGKKMIFVSVLFLLVRLGWTIYGVYLVAKEVSCVVNDGVANGVHLFSIISVSSNFLQIVAITLIGSFLVGVKVSKMIQEEEKKKAERKSLLEHDKLFSVVNQSIPMTEEELAQEDEDELEYDYPVEKPIQNSEFSFPVDEIIVEDEVQEEVDVEHISMDPIDEIKLKFNL